MIVYPRTRLGQVVATATFGTCLTAAFVCNDSCVHHWTDHLTGASAALQARTSSTGEYVTPPPPAIATLAAESVIFESTST